MTYAILAVSILLAVGAVLWYRRRTRRILHNMSRMLDIAMQGDFTEASFDESMLSALESKLAHYLAASTVSARNVQTEKDKLKALIGDISHQTKTPIANILHYTQLLMEQRIASAESVEDIYNENNEFQESFVMEALQDALGEAIEEDARMETVEFTVNLVWRDNKWWVVPDAALLSALSGGIA